MKTRKALDKLSASQAGGAQKNINSAMEFLQAKVKTDDPDKKKK